jgi:hypothetical protein
MLAGMGRKVDLPQGRLRKALIALGGVAAIATVLVIAIAHCRNGESRPGTWERLSARTHAGMVEFQKCVSAHGSDSRTCNSENHAFVALVRALNEVFVSLRDKPDDREAALVRARSKLVDYYEPDEADAFKLYVGEGVFMLYVTHNKNQSVWLARDERQLITDPAKLPTGARAAIEGG